MGSSLHRLLIFIIMVSTGTVLILFDLPLMVIMAIVAAIGFLLLVLLSPATASEIKSSILNLDQISLIRRQKSRKTYIKIGEHKAAEPQQVIEFKVEPFEIAKKPLTDKEKGISLNPGTIASSFKSLGTMLRRGKKPDRNKVEEIDRLHDKTVSEKGNVSALARAGELSADSGIAGGSKPGGPGGTRAGPGSSPHPVDDLFLSLSSDELESGFPDTVDEEDKKGTGIKPDTPSTDAFPPYVPGSSGVTIGESDIPIPPQEVPLEGPPDVEKPSPSDEPDLEGFDDFGATDTIDQNLDELDTIDLDSVELNDETWEEETDTEDSPPPSPPEIKPLPPEATGTAGSAASAASAAPAISPPRVPGMNQNTGDLTDMTVFTAPVSEDDLMVRSLAADIRIARKTKDVSLLRELKDYKAPAKKIEEELSDLYSGLNKFSEKKAK
jgi:hypothetical protein